MEDKKISVGEALWIHENKWLDAEDDVRGYRRAMEPKIIESIWITIANALKQDIYKNKNFYIVLSHVNDRIVRYPRNVVHARQSCPTPVFRQSVWKYHHESSSLEFLWSIPDKIYYYAILNNKTKYLENKRTRSTAQTVILMEKGDLLKWVIKENGEKKDALIIINNLEEYA